MPFEQTDAGRKVNSSTDLRKLETSVQKLPVIMKGLVCIPLGNRAVLKSVAAPSVVPAHSQAGQGNGPAEKEPSKKSGVLAGAKPGSGSWCSHACLCGPTFPNRNEDVFGENVVLRSL